MTATVLSHPMAQAARAFVVTTPKSSQKVTDRLLWWFRVAWIVVALDILWLELTFSSSTPEEWLRGFGSFTVLEIIGALRTASGDTFSEGVWAFIGGYRARRWIGYGLAGALTFRLFTMPGILADFDYSYMTDPVAVLPWAMICAAVGAWLVDHFPNLGANG